MKLSVTVGAVDTTNGDGHDVVIWWALAAPERLVAFGIIDADDLEEAGDGDTAGPPPRPPHR